MASRVTRPTALMLPVLCHPFPAVAAVLGNLLQYSPATGRDLSRDICIVASLHKQ